MGRRKGSVWADGGVLFPSRGKVELVVLRTVVLIAVTVVAVVDLSYLMSRCRREMVMVFVVMMCLLTLLFTFHYSSTRRDLSPSSI